MWLVLIIINYTTYKSFLACISAKRLMVMMLILLVLNWNFKLKERTEGKSEITIHPVVDMDTFK